MPRNAPLNRDEFLRRVDALHEEGFRFPNQRLLAEVLGMKPNTLNQWLRQDAVWARAEKVFTAEHRAKREQAIPRQRTRARRKTERLEPLPALTQARYRQLQQAPLWPSWRAFAMHLNDTYGAEGPAIARAYLANRWRDMQQSQPGPRAPGGVKGGRMGRNLFKAEGA